jgi:hypothetical protein
MPLPAVHAGAAQYSAVVVLGDQDVNYPIAGTINQKL